MSATTQRVHAASMELHSAASTLDAAAAAALGTDLRNVLTSADRAGDAYTVGLLNPVEPSVEPG